MVQTKFLKFYDLEVNMKFFDILYILIGVMPFNENPKTFFINNESNYTFVRKTILNNLYNFYQETNRPIN